MSAFKAVGIPVGGVTPEMLWSRGRVARPRRTIPVRDDGEGTTTAPLARVRCVATSNITLSGLGTTIDGLGLVEGDRVLPIGQTDTTENRIWIASSGSWTPASDALYQGLEVQVTEGTLYANTRFSITVADPVIGGVTNILWNQTAQTVWSQRGDVVGVGTLPGDTLTARLTTKHFTGGVALAVYGGGTSGQPAMRVQPYNSGGAIEITMTGSGVGLSVSGSGDGTFGYLHRNAGAASVPVLDVWDESTTSTGSAAEIETAGEGRSLKVARGNLAAVLPVVSVTQSVDADAEVLYLEQHSTTGHGLEAYVVDAAATGAAMRGETEGTGYGGRFVASGNGVALSALASGTGRAFEASRATDTTAAVADIRQTHATAAAATLALQNDSSNVAAYALRVQQAAAGGSAPGIYATSAGSGAAVAATGSGSGTGLTALSTGTGAAIAGSITNAISAAAVFDAFNAGDGEVVTATITKAGSSATVISAVNGGTGTGISATATGVAMDALSVGTHAVHAVTTSGASAVVLAISEGSADTGTATGPAFEGIRRTQTNAAATTVATLRAQLSGATPLVGFGGTTDLTITDAVGAGSEKIAAQIEWTWVGVTSGSEEGRFRLKASTGPALLTLIEGDGNSNGRLGFFGVAPVTQQPALTLPAPAGAAYSMTWAQGVDTFMNDVKNGLQTLGLTL